jgi:hypothetical protein
MKFKAKIIIPIYYKCQHELNKTKESSPNKLGKTINMEECRFAKNTFENIVHFSPVVCTIAEKIVASNANVLICCTLCLKVLLRSTSVHMILF